MYIILHQIRVFALFQSHEIKACNISGTARRTSQSYNRQVGPGWNLFPASSSKVFRTADLEKPNIFTMFLQTVLILYVSFVMSVSGAGIVTK